PSCGLHVRALHWPPRSPPAQRRAVRAVATMTALPADLHDARKGGPMRVLLAEDDTRLADVLAQTLSEAGWDVEVHHDGADAFRAPTDLEVLAAHPYDVLLLDWMLPSMDGLTVCRRVRALGVQTPVLMLTARGTTPDKVAGLDGGADDYLTKPMDVDEL